MAQSFFSCQSCVKRSLNALLSLEIKRPYLDTSTQCTRAPFSRVIQACYSSERGKHVERWERKRVAKALRPARADDDETSAVAELTERQKTNLRSELKYLTDPRKLANHIQHVLEHDDIDKARALARLSSRSMANIVSWNHLVDWYMKNGKPKTAIDAYNELKKRGQKPDSHTYLLLLRGLADYGHHPHTLGRALSLYHSMSAPGNKVAPTIMHTNCVLKVCARANDMDSLWDIASNLPKRGPHAADHWTFTTILNSIRMGAITGGIPEEETAEDTARRREAAIKDGRRLWELIIQRWRAGDVYVDEELTCSMGRLLLVGSRPRDWDDVLSLLRQTMGIPRLIPNLGTAARQDLPIPRIRAPNTPPDMKNDSSELEDPHGDAKPGAEFETIPDAVALDVSTSTSSSTVVPRDSSRPTVKISQMHAYAKPGPSTLSLVIEACLKMIAKRAATEYWTLLTDSKGPYAIKPDLDNMHMRLRVFRQSHSSAEAAALIREHIPAARIKPIKKTFTIAMSACVRDSRNPKSFDAANRILDAAMQELGSPSAKTLRLYLDCAEACANVTEHGHADTLAAADQPPKSPALDGLRNAVSIQLRALGRLEPGTVALMTLLQFGNDPRARPAGQSKIDWEEEVKREKKDAQQLVRRMLALYDRVLALCHGRESEVGLSLADKQKCIERKRKLAAFVTRRHTLDVEERIRERGFRRLNKGEGKVGWRVGSTGGNKDDVELERPRRLEEFEAVG